MASFAAVIRKLTDDVIATLDDDDRIQVILSTEKTHVLKNPISSKLTLVKNWDPSQLLIHAEDYFQSGESISLADGVRLEIVSIKMNENPNQVGGKKTRNFFSIKDAPLKKKSCVAIKNTDNMCMARCIAVGLVYLGLINADKKSVRKGDRPVQRRIAQKICNDAGVSIHSKCGINEAKKFEASLDISIKIIDACAFLNMVYSGDMSKTRGVIYLLRSEKVKGHDFHYDLIVNIEMFFGKKHFCNFCDVAFDNTFQHRCRDISDWCKACFNRNCIEKPNEISFCQICGIKTKSSACCEMHKSPHSFCHFFRCSICEKQILRTKKDDKWETDKEIKQRHLCSTTCNVCKQEVDFSHVCYMTRVPFKKHIDKVLYFDFETNFSSGVHKPIFCCVRWVFKKNKKIIDQGQKTFGLKSDITDDVGKFIFSKKFLGATVIAHNLQGFDGCFLIQYLIKNNLKPTNVILNGTKITYLAIQKFKIRLIDSLNLIPLPLSQFSKAFGLKECDKGNFPYRFMRDENFNYIGPIPPLSEYGIEEMTPARKADFEKWYETQKDIIFNFKEEIRKYCVQDVLILEQGVEKFRELIMELTDHKNEFHYQDIINENECPEMNFENFIHKCQSRIKPIFKKTPSIDETSSCDPIAYITLAGVCHAIYKCNYISENSIAQIPPGGYKNQKYSNASIEWLEFLNQKRDHKINHKLNSKNGSETKIGGYRVDGVEKETMTVYEFNGCFFHGHPPCISNSDSKNPVTKTTFKALYEHTQKKKFDLEKLGYKVKEMWECEWKLKKENNPDIIEFLHEFDITSPLCPKDAFFGGRVETFRLICENEECEYVDVTSLYPYVISRKKFPVGHPTIILSDFDDIKNYFGFIKCSILPPKKLKIPVLPVRVNGKLLFPLCLSCAKSKSPNYCNHEDIKRQISGTWFTEEVKLAIEMGYKIKKVHQVYHFEHQSTRLFTSYMNDLYKIKLLASGEPSGINITDYIAEVKEKEGIDLKDAVFKSNPGLRYIAKILLNSFWGRFAMKEEQAQFTFISSVTELYQMLNNASIEITNIRTVRENMVGITHKPKNISLVDITNTRNIYIAVLTTGWARIELYKHLRSLTEGENSQVLYCDTDSVIYSKKVTPFRTLNLSPFMGGLTNELGATEHIIDFVSAGPKNYGYKTNCDNGCLKVKGFSLSSINQTAFNINNIKQMIKEYAEKNNNGIFITLKSEDEFQEHLKTARRQFFEKHSEAISECSAFFHPSFAISVFNPNKISRTKEWCVISRNEQKMFYFNYDKRLVLTNFSTVPFGYTL